MMATETQATMPSHFVSSPSSRSSGDGLRATPWSIPAILPISVFDPVAVTIIVAVPRVTEVFWKSMFERSPSAVSGSSRTAASFGTGALSPVSAAS